MCCRRGVQCVRRGKERRKKVLLIGKYVYGLKFQGKIILKKVPCFGFLIKQIFYNVHMILGSLPRFYKLMQPVSVGYVIFQLIFGNSVVFKQIWYLLQM